MRFNGPFHYATVASVSCFDGIRVPVGNRLFDGEHNDMSDVRIRERKPLHLTHDIWDILEFYVYHFIRHFAGSVASQNVPDDFDRHDVE